jgi:galactofuranose transport system ATP-binding protein
MPGAPLLVMSDIDKRFAGIPALSAASFEVGAGEVHALIGQNGAGKSTLIKVLTGYYKRDGGAVLFDGQPFEVSSPEEAQARGISTIYQEINLVGFRSVTENICLGREMRRFGLLDWPRMHQAASELLARFSLKLDVRRPLDTYPIATQQMVAIARAVGFSSKLVIMDEPTSSLDDREVEVLFGVIRQLKASGVSVVFVSHKLDELYEVCDRVTIMRDGRTVRSAPMAEVSKLDLVATMLGRDLKTVARQGATGFGEKASGAHKEILAVSELQAPPHVDKVDIAVGAGEIVGMAGLLGSGRTESVRAVFGVDRPRSGEIRLDGQPFRPKAPADAIAAGLGFCTEDRKLEGIVPDLSVRENLTLALLPHLTRAGIVDEAEQRRIVDKFIARLGVRCASPEQPIRELSGGNQQKVLLARWLCTNPRLLILDEPTRGIDVGAKAEIQSLIRELAAQGLGVLMVSSEVEEIIEGSDRAYVLRDGRTVAELSGTDLNEHSVLAAMAHGSDADHRRHEAPLDG